MLLGSSLYIFSLEVGSDDDGLESLASNRLWDIVYGLYVPRLVKEELFKLCSLKGVKCASKTA